MNEEEINDAVHAVAIWLEYVDNPSPPDADHSSLLRRLLRGKKPLKKAPPRRFSYPCYDLAEGKEVDILEATDWPERGKVVIDQCGDWVKAEDRPGLAGDIIHVPSREVYTLKIGEPRIEGVRYYSGITLQKKSI